MDEAATRVEGSDRGEALIEFIVVIVAIVVPLLYGILALANLQSTAFAAEAASREAARILAADPGAGGVARAQIALAFGDFGVPEPDEVEMSCEPVTCMGPDAVVSVQIATSAALPLVPTWVGSPGLIPVSSTAQAPVEGIRVGG